MPSPFTIKMREQPVKWQKSAAQASHFLSFCTWTAPTFWNNHFHSTQVRREMLRLRLNCIRLTALLFSPSRLKWAVAMETHRGPSPHWPCRQSRWRGKWKSRHCQSRYFFLLFPPSPLSLCVGQLGSPPQLRFHTTENLPRPFQHRIRVQACCVCSVCGWLLFKQRAGVREEKGKRKNKTFGGSKDESQAGPNFYSV